MGFGVREPPNANKKKNNNNNNYQFFLFFRRYGKTWSALHAIRGYRMQTEQKGATVPKNIWAHLANYQQVRYYSISELD